jgi:hypothetical protein
MRKMGDFLLNDFGEVLLEIASGFNFQHDILLEVNELAQSAVLKSEDNTFNIDYVHRELMLPLKRNRYLFVVERNNQFYAMKSKLAKVIFVE